MNNSPIIEGNEWRFGTEKQPNRVPTMKQQSKTLERLLTMPFEEVKNIALSASTPVFLRSAAEKICDGNIVEVVGLIAEYRKANKRKEVV